MTVESRGTSNTNDRGSAESRRQRKRWLFETWAADVDMPTPDQNAPPRSAEEAEFYLHLESVPRGTGAPAVRCFRCGCLLNWDTVECDRIKPGAEGGRYQKNNIRPVCGPCNKVLAGEWVKRRNAKRAAANQRRRAARASARAARLAAEFNA